MAVKPGQYLKGFTVGYKVDEYGNRMAVATQTMSIRSAMWPTTARA